MSEDKTPPLPINTAVKIVAGPWQGLAGRVDPLTSSVTDGRSLIVKVPEPTAGTKREKSGPARFVPRGGRLVVWVEQVEPAA